MAMPKDKKKILDKTMLDLNNKYNKGGRHVVDYACNKEEELKIRYIKTPSYEFNIMLGGGFGVGRVIELFGNNSCGKTSIALETIGYNQKKNKDFVAGYFETESSYDPEYARMLGVDTDRLVYWDQRDYAGAEQALEVLRGVVASGTCDMIVINSVAGLSIKEENIKDLDSVQVGGQARLMSKLLRIIVGTAAKTNTTLVFVNQMRQKVGVLFGNPNITSGGVALGFYSSQRVNMSKYKLDDKKDPIKNQDGIKVHNKAVKNRLAKGNPYKECNYYARYGIGIDSLLELPSVLERENIVRVSGSWFYYEDDKTGDPMTIAGVKCKFNGKKAFIKELTDNEKLRKFFEDKLYEELEKGNISSQDMDVDDEAIKAAEELEEVGKKIDEEVAVEEA